MNDGSCIRLRPQWKTHVWSYDFVEDRTQDIRKLRMLTVIDEFARESLAIVVARYLRSDDVLHTKLAGVKCDSRPIRGDDID